MKKDLPILFFEFQRDLEAWFDENHATSREIWLRLAKKNSGVQSVSRSEALDAALCFGWIDGQAAPLDDQFWLQRFTPRRPKSKWSLINCKKVTDLAAQGRMRPAGLKEIEAAKRDGRWERAYASPKDMTVPDDLQKRLDENPKAREFFANLNSRNRYAILYRILDAKKEETRARRIEQFVAMLNDQKTIY